MRRRWDRPPASVKERMPAWKGLVIAALLVELVVIVVLVRDRGIEPVRSSDETTTSAATERFDEPGAPYSFAYPDKWELENDGSVTKLLSPGNDIAIAVGPAPSGDVLASSDQLVEGVAARYTDAETKSRELTRVNGNLGVSVSGTAVNQFGVSVRFSIVTVEGENKNYAITAFAAQDVEVDVAERALAEVVEDFEIN